MVCRLHTFLFADLSGFTSFTARHGDERAADLALAFHERVHALARELGCEVVKSIGDAVMVRGENGSATLELARRILALAGEGAFPPVRAGLATGPAVRRGGDWFGATVNTASRVAAAARAGELLMTESAHVASDAGAIARGRYRLRGLPDHALFAAA